MVAPSRMSGVSSALVSLTWLVWSMMHLLWLYRDEPRIRARVPTAERKACGSMKRRPTGRKDEDKRYCRARDIEDRPEATALGCVSAAQIDPHMREAYRQVHPDEHGQRHRPDADHHRKHRGHDEGCERLDRVHVDAVDPVERVVVVRGDDRARELAGKSLGRAGIDRQGHRQETERKHTDNAQPIGSHRLGSFLRLWRAPRAAPLAGCCPAGRDARPRYKAAWEKSAW